MNLIYIILPLAVQLFRRRPGHGNGRIIQNRLTGVISMSLHGDCIYIIRFFCRIQTFQDFICQNAILYPAKWILQIFIFHVLLRGKGIKPQIRKNRSSAIEICFIVMYRMSRISKILQNIRNALTGSLFEYTLIRILTRTKIMKTHSRNCFKFRICSTCSNSRHLIISGRIFLHQLPEIGNRILRNIQIIYQCRIKEGFQLKKQNIRSFSIFLGFRKIGLCLLNSLNFFL